jgi:signal transduction histidine kinase/uncharacterized protein YhfF
VPHPTTPTFIAAEATVAEVLPVTDDRRTSTELLRLIAAGTATEVGTAFLRSLVHHVVEALEADVAFIAEGDEDSAVATVLASAGRDAGDLPEGLEFLIAGTPCSLTFEHDVVKLAVGTLAAFPEDAYAARHELDGYLAIVMRGADGRRLGHLAVMSAGRLDAGEETVAVLRIFASRAGAELERRRQEEALRRREAEVAASRVRLVSVADEERRRIGRNLHDGAQQRLIVLGHRLTIAERKLQLQATEEAVEHLRVAAEEARAAGAELRELARGLHPAGLAEYGLEPALAALAGRSPLPVQLEALPDRRLPEVVEVSVYYLVSEAVANACKYAGASSVRVRVVQERERVLAEVADDGSGGADIDRGTGLKGLAERLEALDGRLEIVSPPGGGTLLRATIPVAPYRTPREPFLEFRDQETIGQVLSGQKTASISLAREWELEGGTPAIGTRLPVRDLAGARHGTVEVARVSVMPFRELDAGAVQDQDPDAPSHEEWLARRRRFYADCREEIAAVLGEPGWRLRDDEPMVVLRYRLVEDQ